MATTTTTTSECGMCRRPGASWLRTEADPAKSPDPVPLCSTCKGQSERHGRRRYAFLPLNEVRAQEALAAAKESTPPPPTLGIDRDVAPVGHHHPATAKRAALKALPRTGTKRRMTYDLIRAHGGMTAEEVGKAFGWPHQTYSAAVSTLAKDGWLRESGYTRPTDAGNEAHVYVVTPEPGR